MKRLRARFTFTLVATTLIGAVLPIVAVVAQSSAAAALPIVAQGTDAYYSTNLHYSDTMNYPPGATGFTQETFTTTVASQPSWKSDAAYFYANQVGFSAVPQPAPTLEDEGSIYSAAGNPSTTSFPTSYGDLLVAFVSSQTIASNLTVTGTAAGHAALPFTRLTLPNNPSSIAIFTAFDYYLPATTSVVVSVGNAAAGPVMGLTVEAYSYANGVGVIAENSSAGGGGAGSGAPSVSMNTGGGNYPSRVLGVGYDPTSATTITPSAADALDSHSTDSSNHATLWVQSQVAPVSSSASNPVVLSDTVASNDAWQYASIEIKAQGLGLYVGINPNYNSTVHSGALFSYFGSGATTLAATCSYSADGATGVSCVKSFAFVEGHKFQTQVTAVVSGSLTKFTGTVKDLTANTAAVTIGSWKLPTSIGLLKVDPTGFTEWYAGGTSCTSLPYARVLNGAPTAVANDTNHTVLNGTFKNANSATHKCAAAENKSNTLEMSTTGESRVNPDVTGKVTSAQPSAAVVLAPQAPGDLLVASISTYTGATVSVSGGGLSWTKAFEARDGITNDGGLISVWTARASSTFPAPSVTVTSSITGNAGWAQTLSVTGYVGAAGIGASQFSTGPVTSSPSVTLTPQQTGSWVSTAGFDADSTATVTPGAGQTIDATAQDTVLNAEMWFQHDTTTLGGQTVPALTTTGVPITIADTLSPTGAWDLGAVEITPAPKVNLVYRTLPVTGTGTIFATVMPVNSSETVTQGDLLVAYVSTTNSATVTVSSPDGCFPAVPIIWSQIFNQADSISGDGGRISVWQAQIPDCYRNSVEVDSAITGNLGWAQSLVVEEFNGAAAVANTVPPAFAHGAVGTSPSVNITSQSSGSWIAAIGFDADSPTTVTAGPNQFLSATAEDDVFFTEMWFQYSLVGSSASQVRTLNDTLSPSGAWDLAAVEIMPQT